jgi:type I restriction-modification system DNA methylase subunit
MNGNLNWITNFIWGIADDVLRDVYVRGKYRDVILPMTELYGVSMPFWSRASKQCWI